MAGFQRAIASENRTDEKSCRVCKETNDPESMISPCACTGTMKWIHPGCWERSNQVCIPCRRNLPPPTDDTATFAPFQMMFETIIPPRGTLQHGERGGGGMASLIEPLTPLMTALCTPLVNEYVSQIEKQGAARLRIANLWAVFLESRAWRAFTLILMTYFVIYLTMYLLIMARNTYYVLSN